VDLTLEALQKELKGWQAKVETSVKEIIGSGASDAKEKTKGLTEEITAVKDLVGNLEKQIKAKQLLKIPGAEKDVKKFDLGKYVLAQLRNHPKFNGSGDVWERAEIEKELCKAAGEQRQLANKELGMIVAKSNIADDGSDGGFLIPEEVTNEIIDLAIAKMPIMNMGTTILRGLVGDLPVPKLTGRPTSFFVGENEAPAKSKATFGELTLRPKKVAGFVKISNRLIHQTRGVADTVIRQSLTDSVALQMHLGLVRGTGSDKQPLGIFNASGFTSNNISLGVNGRRFRIDDAAAMDTALDVADELIDSPDSFGYLLRPEVLGGMKRERVKQFSSQAEGDGQPILMTNPLLSNKVLEDIIGYKIRTTTQILNNEVLGTSTASSTAIFGNWKHFWVGMWRDFAIKVSDVAGDGSTGSAFLDDQLYVLGMQEFDSRAMRATAFTTVAGAETDESAW